MLRFAIRYYHYSVYAVLLGTFSQCVLFTVAFNADEMVQTIGIVPTEYSKVKEGCFFTCMRTITPFGDATLGSINSNPLAAQGAALFSIGKRRMTRFIKSIAIVPSRDTCAVSQAWQQNIRRILTACLKGEGKGSNECIRRL